MEEPPPTQHPARRRPVPFLEAPLMAQAFRAARASMSAVPAKVNGYRLFWVRGTEVGWKDLPAGGPYAIAGSHECCDVRLTGPGIALRHLLVTTVALADGLALRLLDLHTETPFVLQDDSRQRSIVAAGPVVVRLGGTVLGGVPIEAGEAPPPPEPEPALPEIVVETSSRVPSSVHSSKVNVPAGEPALESGPVSRRGGSLSSKGTAVTSMPPPRLVADLPAGQLTASAALRLAPCRRDAPRASPNATPPHGSPYRVAPAPGGEGETWAVTLEHQQQAASVSLSDEALEQGVVIGRATSCIDQGLKAVLGHYISRGHVLLLHHHDAYEAFDLRSLNGTWEGGDGVKRRLLGAGKVRLELGDYMPVVLHWHGRR